jgi:hypothetical protein
MMYIVAEETANAPMGAVRERRAAVRSVSS